MANPSLGKKFQFISIQNPEDAKDRKTRRLARSHAVARSLERKRWHLQQSGQHFLNMSMNDGHKTKESNRNKKASSLISAPTLAPGPFQLFAAESPRLQVLFSQLSLDGSIQTPEPRLSMTDELVLQNFQTVLRKGLNDRALLNAVMLMYYTAYRSNRCDSEHFKYQTEALSSLRRNLNSLDVATSESTLGAILLLAGIEARLGMPRSVQLHMGAIQQLLDLCQRRGTYLGDAIKRAIFWQDLNCSVMTGSTRIVDHTTFPELKWTRHHFFADYFVLPPGFKPVTSMLGDEFIEILKDVYALQCIRDNLWGGTEEVISMAYIDNHQANIQSRLVGLSSHSSFSECCHLALYLCSTMLRCKIWRTSVIPSHLSLQLLRKLQEVIGDLVWDDHRKLLLWMLYIGGAFAPVGSIRSEYAGLLRENRKARLGDLDSAWPDLKGCLKEFIWSEKAFASHVEAFWMEISIGIEYLNV